MSIEQSEFYKRGRKRESIVYRLKKKKKANISIRLVLWNDAVAWIEIGQSERTRMR